MAEPGGVLELEPPKPGAKRPGGPHYPRPPVIEGVTYDPFHPLKSVQNPDGTEKSLVGREMSPGEIDEMYARRFWARRQPPGLRGAMIETIKEDALTGTTGIFASPNGITEKDREKMSARR